MSYLLKRLLFAFTYNLSIFLILLIGIQNSDSKRKINFIFSETVNLPISFIIGVSFISGSLTGSILSLKFKEN